MIVVVVLDTLTWYETHLPRLGGEFLIRFARMKFQPVQPGQVSHYDYMRKSSFIPARQDSFPPAICLDLLTFSLDSFSCLGGLKRLHWKISSRPGSRQYKGRIPLCWDETSQMQSQDMIYQEFITLPRFWQNKAEFHAG